MIYSLREKTQIIQDNIYADFVESPRLIHAADTIVVITVTGCARKCVHGLGFVAKPGREMGKSVEYVGLISQVRIKIIGIDPTQRGN